MGWGKVDILVGLDNCFFYFIVSGGGEGWTEKKILGKGVREGHFFFYFKIIGRRVSKRVIFE